MKQAAKIVFATTNEEKLREVRAFLSRYSIEVEQSKIDVDEIKSLDIAKTAEKKALDSYALLKKPLVVEDTGIFFRAFNSFPGTYSKFCVETIGVANAVSLLRGSKTEADFVTVACYADGKQTKCFEGKIGGKVVLQPRGVAPPKLPYDPYFVPEGSEKTYAEMGFEEKNRLSHRALAFRKFAEWLANK